MRPLPAAIAVRSLLPRWAALLALAAAVPACARPADGRTSADPSEIQVTASLRELRVVFPRDTAGAWGWSGDRRPGYFSWYQWSVAANGLGGSERLFLTVPRPDGRARAFPSLDSLVAAGEAKLCGQSGCVTEGVEARVEGGRVTLLLRDSAAIARWMGLRPDTVRVRAHGPGETLDPGRTVRVEHVAPLIPRPSAEARDRAELTRRVYERKRHRLTRSIAGGSLSSSPELWMAVGDTARLEVRDLLCEQDICRSDVVEGGRWTVEDAGVARLREEVAGGRTVTGVRPGRTRIRVAGLPAVRDTLLSHDTVPRVLAREVIVTPPIARVEISLPSTVTMHDVLEVRPAVHDRAGGRIENAPVVLRIGSSWHVMPVDGVYQWTFTEPGRYTVTASFGGVSDTAEVTVLPRAPR